ncbi:hypothetical protein BCR43DRAFT_263347 [Syncephalastrum racemosum]|uniref:Uncharacterized protein n=1 Tax=Syncephalastrum racemosum TaxID=13706 RepID=A0A1X2HGV4_SYNRA|nr:hypothetical protein BCR43DRAFT_263347 [Syncephalastrum racemosum]
MSKDYIHAMTRGSFWSARGFSAIHVQYTRATPRVYDQAKGFYLRHQERRHHCSHATVARYVCETQTERRGAIIGLKSYTRGAKEDIAGHTILERGMKQTMNEGKSESKHLLQSTASKRHQSTEEAKDYYIILVDDIFHSHLLSSQKCENSVRASTAEKSKRRFHELAWRKSSGHSGNTKCCMSARIGVSALSFHSFPLPNTSSAPTLSRRPSPQHPLDSPPAALCSDVFPFPPAHPLSAVVTIRILCFPLPPYLSFMPTYACLGSCLFHVGQL